MSIAQPQSPQFEAIGENAGRFVIAGCHPGYGMTIGNALRRVILSSLDGAAITAMKIDGISHEFSSVDGVMEDAVQIMMNLKRVHVRSFSDEPITVSLSASGEGVVTAGQIKTTADVQIVNPDHVIATITDKKKTLDMEFEIRRGIGYQAVEQQEEIEQELGKIAIDAIFTPIKRVKYLVENMRVGKRTDYDKVIIDIVTDGSVTPEEAFAQGVDILIGQFGALTSLVSATEAKKVQSEKVAEKPAKKEAVKLDRTSNSIDVAMKLPIGELVDLSTRTGRVLEENKVTTVKDIATKTEEELLALDGIGEKGVKEIRKAIGVHGITLK